MKYFYSPSTNGFYVDNMHLDMPSDAVEITNDLRQQLLDGQSQGKIISPPDATHKLPWLADQPAPTLEEAKSAKLAEVMTGYSAAFAPVDLVYPPAEREGWAIQESEAVAYMADQKAEVPVLTSLVTLRGKGETILELAQKVLENAIQWRGVYAHYTGQQQRMYSEVAALTLLEDVQSYEVVYTTPA